MTDNREAAPMAAGVLPTPDIRVDAFGDVIPTDGRRFVMGDFYSADQMRAALASPSPAPQAPAGQGERATFEAWYCADGNYEPEWLDGRNTSAGWLYSNFDTENMWTAFAAGRASMQAAPQAPAGQASGFAAILPAGWGIKAFQAAHDKQWWICLRSPEGGDLLHLCRKNTIRMAVEIASMQAEVTSGAEVQCVVAMDEGAREPRLVSWNEFAIGTHRLYATPQPPAPVAAQGERDALTEGPCACWPGLRCCRVSVCAAEVLAAQRAQEGGA